MTTSPINPRVILLDLDGTLADSLSIMRNAYRLFLRQFHREPTDVEFDSLNGPSFLEIIHRLKYSHALKEDEHVLLTNYFAIIDNAYTNVKPSIGAIDFLKKAKENYCTIGIVTSNTKKRTQTWLETVHLSQLIEFIISGDDVEQAKPHPEPYVIASKKTSYKPTEIVAIEDSPQGAQSAIDAGLKTFVLNHEKNHVWPQGIELISSLTQAAKKLW